MELHVSSSTLILDATSSRRLKQQSKRPVRRENAKTRLARAAANAAALYPKQHSLSATQQSTSLGSLQQLTHAIDEQLMQKQNNFSSKPMMQPQDSMSSLLDFNTEHEHANCCYTVALVFGQDVATRSSHGGICRPDTNTGAVYNERAERSISCAFVVPNVEIIILADADAGYTYFRHLCASQKVDLSAVDIIMDRTCKDEAAVLVHLVKHLQAHYIADWLQEAVLEKKPAVNEYSLAQRKKIHVHLELISTGYHLCNLNDIHHRSPGQSLLRPVELMRREYSSFAQYEVWDDDDERFRGRTWWHCGNVVELSICHVSLSICQGGCSGIHGAMLFAGTRTHASTH